MFKEHMRDLFNKRRKDFRDLLDESKHIINPFSSYDTIKEELKDE